MITMKLEGARDLRRALEDLPKRTSKNVVRRALRQAAQPVADQAANLVSNSKPELAKAITVATTLSRRQRRARPKQGDVEVFIGPRAARFGVAHLIEFGTGPRYHKSGKYTGQMPARPFLRPAWEAGKLAVLQRFSKLLWVEIEKASKRAARKAAKAIE